MQINEKCQLICDILVYQLSWAENEKKDVHHDYELKIHLKGKKMALFAQAYEYKRNQYEPIYDEHQHILGH